MKKRTLRLLGTVLTLLLLAVTLPTAVPSYARVAQLDDKAGQASIQSAVLAGQMTSQSAALAGQSAGAAGLGSPIGHSAFQNGDVFVGWGDGHVLRYAPQGNLLDDLDTTSHSLEEGGLCFDETGQLYASDFTKG